METALFLKEQKLLRTLEECKQIPKDDRLLIRKLLRYGNVQAANILDDNKNKKLQIRLRKFLQKQKENKKSEQITRKPSLQRYRHKQNLGQRKQSMMKQLLEFKNNLQMKDIRTEGNSMRNSGFYGKINDESLKTIENYQNFTQVNTQNQNDKIFTPPHLLQDIKNFSQSNKKSKPYENSKQIFTHTFDKFDKLEKVDKTISIPLTKLSMNNFFSPNTTSTIDVQYEKEQLLKNTLIDYYAEDLFQFVCGKHFPLSISSGSVYLPYRKLLEEIKQYTSSNNNSSDNPSFPSSLTSSKVSTLISSMNQDKNQGPKSFVDESSCKIPILQPFQSQFQSVTLDKLGLFLSKYCMRRNNEIRNLFIIIGSDMPELNKQEGQSLSIDRFTKINQWKGQDLIQDFTKVVRKWGTNDSISYWRMHSVKDQPEIQAFITRYRNF